MTSRIVKEGRQIQGTDEKIVYTITTTPWGTSPSSLTAVVKDESASNLDVTSTVMPGTPTAVGDVITLPQLKSLTVDHLYRVEVKFDAAGNTFECYFEVQAEL